MGGDIRAGNKPSRSLKFYNQVSACLKQQAKALVGVGGGWMVKVYSPFCGRISSELMLSSSGDGSGGDINQNCGNIYN